MLKSGNLKLFAGDGRLGYADDAPYDAIHVGAAAAEIPQAVIIKLKLIFHISNNNIFHLSLLIN